MIFILETESWADCYVYAGLLDDGDEVRNNARTIRLGGCKLVWLVGMPFIMSVMSRQNRYPDIDDIKSKITSNTKAIIIINPNN